MSPLAPDSVLSALQWRYATKKFDPSRKIPIATWEAIERAAVLAPSSMGMQPWKFVVVTDPGVRARLRPVSYNQPQITDASHLIVFCRRTAMDESYVHQYARRISEVRAVPVSTFQGFVDSMLKQAGGFATNDALQVWTSRQVYIALGFALSAAAVMGVDACPMEGIEGPKYDQVLGLKDTPYAATVVGAFGYRSPDDTFASLAKVRFDPKDVIMRV